MAIDLFARLDEVGSMVRRGRCGLVIDCDGTISEIVASADTAFVSPSLRRYLGELARHLALVAVVSGRSADDVRGLVGVEELVYVGNHGMEWWADGDGHYQPDVLPYLPVVADALQEIRSELSLQGVVLENKGATVAIHYRQSADIAAARDAILSAVGKSSAAKRLTFAEGKKVIELRAPVALDKGWALAKLVQDHLLSSVIYVGDDLTDVEAFIQVRALRESGRIDGLAIAVLSSETPRRVIEYADATLQHVMEVERFIGWVAQDVETLALSRSEDMN